MPITRCNAVGFRLILGIALLVTLYSTLTPQNLSVLNFNHADKLEHLLAFLGLAFLVDAGWPASKFSWKKYLPLILLGIVIECLQFYIPHRSFSVLDILADTAGVTLYGLVLLPILKKLNVR